MNKKSKGTSQVIPKTWAPRTTDEQNSSQYLKHDRRIVQAGDAAYLSDMVAQLQLNRDMQRADYIRIHGESSSMPTEEPPTEIKVGDTFNYTATQDVSRGATPATSRHHQKTRYLLLAIAAAVMGAGISLALSKITPKPAEKTPTKEELPAVDTDTRNTIRPYKNGES